MSGVPLRTAVPEPTSTNSAQLGIVVPVIVIVWPSASVAVITYAYAASSVAVVSAVLVILGASLTLVTVRTYWSDAVSAPSLQVTVIVCAPTFALVGVPEITPAVVAVIVLGAPEIV